MNHWILLAELPPFIIGPIIGGSIAVVGALVGAIIAQEVARLNMWRRDATDVLRRILVASYKLADIAPTQFIKQEVASRHGQLFKATDSAALQAKSLLATAVEASDVAVKTAEAANTLRSELNADLLSLKVMFGDRAAPLNNAIICLLDESLSHEHELEDIAPLVQACWNAHREVETHVAPLMDTITNTTVTAAVRRVFRRLNMWRSTKKPAHPARQLPTEARPDNHESKE